MNFSLLTYNVLFNKAFHQIGDILERYQPDIICLQEVDTSERNLKKFENNSYFLADYANCFIKFGKIYGVATYYNRNKFKLLNSKPIPLSRSLYESLSSLIQIFKKRGVRRTILKTDFYCRPAKKKITFYNLHLSVISLNKLRLKQLNTIDFAYLKNKNPLIITGDFNFPIERKRLEDIMKRYNLKEATSNLFYTLQYPKNPKAYHYIFIQRLFAKLIKKIWTDKLKLDYIFYRGLKKISTERIEVDFSDHFPILSEFKI